MEARLAQGSLLKKVFEAIKEMVSDVNLECSPEGVSLQAMDASHVSLVMLDLKKGAFDHYQCDRSRTLGLNMAHVAKVFKLCGNDDTVILRNDTDSDNVVFVFETAGDDRVSDFELRLMQLDSEHLGVPENEYDAKVSMPSRHFAKVVADLGQFSDTIHIECTPKGIKFSARGDIGSGNTLYKSRTSENEKIEIRTETTTSLLFATRYLTYFTKAAPLAETVRLGMTNSQPLEVTYHLQDDQEIGFLKFYLAPKMDDTTMTSD